MKSRLKDYFNFSVKRILVACICFIVLFIVTVYLFNLPVTGKSDLMTEEFQTTGEDTGYISDNNVVIQGLFFRKPVRLHSMDVLVSSYDNTVSMKEIKYYVMDNTRQNIYSSTIPTVSITDHSWLHVELGDVSLKPNRRYFIKFQGVAEDENVVCPAFYLMEDNYISDILYINGGSSTVTGKALCATYKYDIIPMSWGAWAILIMLLVFMIGMAGLRSGLLIKNLCQIPRVAWALFWGVLYLGILFGNNQVNMSYFNPRTAVICLLSVLAVIVLGSFFYKRIKKDNKESRMYSLLYEHRRILGIVFFVFLSAVQLMIVTNIYQKIGWDVNASWNNATLWRTDDNAASDWALLTYPNNIGITSVMYFLQRLTAGMKESGQYLFVVIVNTLFVDFGVFMTYKVLMKRKGFSAALIGATMITIIMGISGWITVPYTDTATFWIPVTIIYLYILVTEDSMSERKYILAAFGIGILAVLGYFLKPQCIILLIAIGFAELCTQMHYRKEKRKGKVKKTDRPKCIFKDKLMSLLCGCISGILLFSVVKGAILPDDYTKKYADKYEMVMTQFIMMGLNENPQNPHGGFGGYCDEDVLTVCQYDSKEKKREYCMSVISERLKDFGFAGFVNHLYQKGVWVLGDGTFFWQKEGNFFVEDYSGNDSEIQKFIRKCYYDSTAENNEKHLNFMGFITGIWFLVLCFTVFAPWCMEEDKLISSELAISLSVLGCVIFTLLFEGRSRYVINYLPFFVFFAAAGICKFTKSIGNLQSFDEP